MLNSKQTNRGFQAGVATALTVSVLVVLAALMQAASSIQSFF